MPDILSLLKPGMVGVELKNLSPLSTLDTVLQGDTIASHVWWVLPNGNIATTGAKGLFFYGEVEASKYLTDDKSFILLETVDTLDANSLAEMEQGHLEILHSGIFRTYGLWKFVVIETIHIFSTKEISKTGFKPKTTAPQFPICSQAVGYSCWKAGIRVGKMFGKEDYTAVFPETFLQEAQAVSDIIKNGDFKDNNPNCKYLKVAYFIEKGSLVNLDAQAII